MGDSYYRTAEDVRDMIKFAKLHESEITPLSQILSFPPEQSSFNNLHLLQLDRELLENIAVGDTVVFKGSHDENAVLCTNNSTYDIKDAETSNSMLLVPNLLWGKETKTNPDESFDNSKNESEKLISSDKESPNTTLNNSGDADTYSSPRKVERKDILKVFYTYYEARLCKPRLGKLNELLQLTKYSGPEYEYNIDKSLLVTLDHLNDVIQASDMEILKGLEDLQAIEMDGFYRVLSFDYEFRCLSFMLDLIDENSWSLDRISKNETMRLLKDLFPGVLISKLFDYYTLKTVVEGEEQFYKYKEEKVCRFLARVLLKSAGKFNLDDFLQAWKDSVPDGMTTDEKMLNGIAIIDRESNPQVIWAFYESDLPENVIERLRILFQTKSKWTLQQIHPYIERFTTDKINVNTILTKYARGSNVNNVRYYSAKHSK